MKKKYFFYFLLFCVLTIAIARFGGSPFGHHIKFGLNILFGFLGLSLIMKKNKEKERLIFSILFIAPSLIVTLSIFFNNAWKFYQLATPSSLSFFLGLLLSIVFVKNKNVFFIKLIFIVFFSFWVFNNGYDIWLNKLNYNTFFGYQNIKILNPMKLKNSDNQTFVLDNKDTYYVLDFWTTTCGVCFQKFPEYEKLYKQYKNNKRIKILAVNVPYKDENFNENFLILREKKYGFPIVFFDTTENELIDFNVKAFPTVLIIYNNKIIHIGSVNSARNHLGKIRSE